VITHDEIMDAMVMIALPGNYAFIVKALIYLGDIGRSLINLIY